MALGTFSSTAQRKPYQRGLGMPQQPGQQASPFGSPQAKPLQAPQPMTQNGAMAQQQNLQGLQTGQFGDVQSAQKATDRAGALRQYQAIQSSRANSVRGNLSTEQAQRAQDQSMAAANAQNLTAQNSVNALQRQYGQDALNRADTYENQAYSRGTNERAYGDSRADLGYDRATEASRYGDSRADVQYGRDYQTGRDAVGDQRYSTEYADKRGDVQYGRGIDESRYADTRADVKYGQDYQAGRDTVGDQRYSAETDYAHSRDTVGDARYDDTTQYARGRDAIGDQRYDASTAYSQGRDTLADQRYDASTSYSQGRDAVSDSRYADETNFARTEAKRLEGKGDVNSLISSVQDPRAQNLLRNVQAQGGDVQAMYNTMLDQGTIKEEYRSASPGTTAYQAKVDELKSFYPDKTLEEIQKMALDERVQEKNAVQAPIEKASEQQNIESILAKDRLGQQLTPEEEKLAIGSGTYTPYTSLSLPAGSNAQKIAGSKVNMDGQLFTVVGGSRIISKEGGAFTSDQHKDYTIVKDRNGNTKYVMGGEILDTKPVSKA